MVNSYPPLIERALDAEDRGDLDGAETALREMLKSAPNDGNARQLLGGVLVQKKDWEGALGLLGPLVSEDPDRLGARVNLAHTYLALGNVEAAITEAEYCFRKAPQEPLISDVMIVVATAAGQHQRLGEALLARAESHAQPGQTYVRAAAAFGVAGDEALARKCLSAAKDKGAPMADLLRASFALSSLSYRWSDAVQTATEWHRLDPTSTEASEALSTAWFELGDMDRATDAFLPILNREGGPTPSQSLTYGLLALQTQDLDGAKTHLDLAEQALGPRADLMAGLGRLKTFEGQKDQAIDYCLKALELEPDNSRALTQLAIVTRGRVPAPHDETIERLSDDPSRSDTVRYAMQFAAADIAHAAGDRRRAWGKYRKANEGRAQQASARNQGFDPDTARKTINTLRGFEFTDTTSPDSREPEIIFIVGFPRSGTTLMERVVSRADDIEAGGELTGGAWVQHTLLEEQSQYSKRVISEAQQKTLADLYLTRRPSHLSTADRFTDKAPMNGMVMTALAQQFPRAKFLWCLRQGFDVAASIYRHQFPFAYDWAHRLEDMLTFMPLYAGWMAEQAEGLGDRLLAMDYDRFVEKPTDGISALESWLNLDPGALAHDRDDSTRRVATFSSVQVREPISKAASVGGQDYRHLAGPIADQIDQALSEVYRGLNVKRVP